MAVIIDKGFTSSSSDATFWAAFNNFIIIFHSDTAGKTVSHAFVRGMKFYPDTYGYFHVNLRPIFEKHIFNTNGSKNMIDNSPVATGEVSDYLVNASGITPLLLDVYFTDNTHEANSSIQWVFIMPRASKDMEKQMYRWTEEEYTCFSGDNLTFFKGFPYDFAVGGNTFKIKDSDGDIYTSNRRKVVRFNISTGATNLAFLDGKDSAKLDVVNSKDDVLGHINFKIKDCEGTYIKWLSLRGTYKYWLFQKKKKVTMSVRDHGHIINYFADDETNRTKFISLGKESTDAIMLHASSLSEDERNYIADIIESPRVYLYHGTKNQAATPELFQLVNVKTNSLVIDDYGKKSKISVIIEKKNNGLW